MGGRSAETSLPSVFSFADLRATDLVMEDQLAQANASAADCQPAQEAAELLYNSTVSSHIRRGASMPTTFAPPGRQGSPKELTARRSSWPSELPHSGMALFARPQTGDQDALAGCLAGCLGIQQMQMLRGAAQYPASGNLNRGRAALFAQSGMLNTNGCMPGSDQTQGLQPSPLAPANGANGMEGVELNCSGESWQQGGEMDLSTARTAANSHNSSSACGSSDEDFEGDMRSRRNGARGAGQHVHSWEAHLDPTLPPGEMKKMRRMLSNRESARRSRRRKQAHIAGLEDQVAALQADKQRLARESTQMARALREAVQARKQAQAEVAAARAALQQAQAVAWGTGIQIGGELLTSCLHDEYHRGGSSGSATVHCKVPPPPAGAAPPSFAPQGQPVLGATKPEAPAKPAHLGPRTRRAATEAEAPACGSSPAAAAHSAAGAGQNPRVQPSPTSGPQMQQPGKRTRMK